MWEGLNRPYSTIVADPPWHYDDRVGDLVERVSPGPYVELFARSPRLGWDSWGKGYESAVSA